MSVGVSRDEVEGKDRQPRRVHCAAPPRRNVHSPCETRTHGEFTTHPTLLLSGSSAQHCGVHTRTFKSHLTHAHTHARAIASRPRLRSLISKRQDRKYLLTVDFVPSDCAHVWRHRFSLSERVWCAQLEWVLNATVTVQARFECAAIVHNR